MKMTIENFIIKNKENILGDIRALVRFESVNGRVPENRACLAFFLARAQELGFQTRMTTTEDVGVIEMGTGTETLGILVHLDVVATGDPEKWIDPPFSGAVHDGFIWGRGTVDDKGAAVMCLYAMKALVESGIDLPKKIQLIAGTSEEGNWTDIANFKKEFPVPDFGFSPDGEFPIYHAENGYADIELFFENDSEKGIQSLSAGESVNTIPSKAEITFEDGTRIARHGVSAHSSIPHAGENAIIRLGRFLNGESGKTLAFARFLADFYGESEDGRTFGFCASEIPAQLDKPCVTTAVPTVLRYRETGNDSQNESAYVSLNLNIRHTPGVTGRDLIRVFEPLAKEYGFRFELKEYLDPMHVSCELPFLKTMKKACEEEGVCADFRSAPGTTYAKSMENFVSWGPVLPKDPACAHMENERLSLETMSLATKLYARFLYLYETEDNPHDE